MFSEDHHKPGQIGDIEGHVPLPVIVWLGWHPAAMLAIALAASTAKVRWLFRLSSNQELQIRGSRIEILDLGTGNTLGSARVLGIRSVFDFDTLPRAAEPPPFFPPDPVFPSLDGFACDLDGRIARFLPLGDSGLPAPGLVPRVTRYETTEPRMDTLLYALSIGHSRAAYPACAFAARARDLVRAAESATGTARLYAWFDDDRVMVWPSTPSDWAAATLAALHAQGRCLGCSRHDPRDPLVRGTYAYAQAPHGETGVYARTDVPDVPLDVTAAAHLLGRSAAELAATQLSVRFETASRVDLARIRRAT